MAVPAVAGAARVGVLGWQHRRVLLWLLALVIGVPLAVALMVVITITGSGGAGAGQFKASAFALRDIPPAYLTTYQAAGTTYELGWEYLAAIGKIETDHGRSSAPGVRSGVNFAGCCAGPMQFNIRNGPPSTWDSYGIDGNRDGRRSPYDPADAIP